MLHADVSLHTYFPAWRLRMLAAPNGTFSAFAMALFLLAGVPHCDSPSILYCGVYNTWQNWCLFAALKRAEDTRVLHVVYAFKCATVSTGMSHIWIDGFSKVKAFKKVTAIQYYIERNTSVFVSGINWNNRQWQTMLIRGELFIVLWSIHSICETRSLALWLCHWPRFSFAASTKLYVVKLITNSNPTLPCISINQVDDSTERVWKCMCHMIIRVSSPRSSEWFVV